MIIKKNIKKTLKGLDKKYNIALTSSDPNEPIFYSKMALLEYCGWIEESFDLIAKRTVKGKVKTSSYQQIFKYSIIESNHGFQYKEHFRKMMIKCIGVVQMEILEKQLIREGEKDNLINELDSVKTQRNDAAHTWIEGRTQTYPAPSYTLRRLEIIYPILRFLYSKAIQINSSFP